jgi:glycosyltransferase involved in cell wall biosynthesis
MKLEQVPSLESFEVLIVGLVRNCEPSLESEVETLRASFEDFKNVSFFLVESDSTDGSLEALRELATRIPNFQFLSLGNLRQSISDRIERIAHCRNAYLDYVRTTSKKFDYVVVADLDGVNNLLTKEKVATCWKFDGWSVCTANQTGPYYDIYALRAPGWSEMDCWNEARSLYASGMNPVKSWVKAIRDKQRIIPESEDWIEVTSAFGGLAIYKTEAFLKGNYQTFSDAELNVSEHVPFNLKLVASGHRIFINPKLTNFAFNEHNDFSRLSRQLKMSFKYLMSLFAPNWVVNLFMPHLSMKNNSRIAL